MTDENSPDTIREALIIAIDGPAGAGKSTIARMVAAELGVPYLDTGAMYRAVGLLAQRHGFYPPYDERTEERIVQLVSRHDIRVSSAAMNTTVEIDGEDVSDKIRSPECSELASAVSSLSGVRRRLVALQRELSAHRGGVVEGRDIGSVVFPDATLKVFLTASADERARRRLGDLEGRGVQSSLQEVLEQQEARDLQDSTRLDSPLEVAAGAVVVDTTGLSPTEVVKVVIARLRIHSSRESSDCVVSGPGIGNGGGDDPRPKRNDGVGGGR